MDEHDHRHYLGDEDPPDYENTTTFQDRLVIDVPASTLGDWRQDPECGSSLYLVQAKPDAQATGLVDTGVNLFFRFHQLLVRFGEAMDLDYLLIDCRSGISNLGLPGLAYCDLAVVFTRWGTQHRYGTEKLLDWYREWLSRAELEKEIILVPSTIDFDRTQPSEVEDFCANQLKIDNYIMIPVIPTLLTRDTLLWKVEDSAHAEHYARLALRLADLGGK